MFRHRRVIAGLTVTLAFVATGFVAGVPSAAAVPGPTPVTVADSVAGLGVTPGSTPRTGVRTSPAQSTAARRTAASSTGTSTYPAGVPLDPVLTHHVASSCSRDADGTGADPDADRVQAVYLHAADQPDRFAQVQPQLLSELADVDDAFLLSARKTGGGRLVRWVHDATCVPTVLDVPVAATAFGQAGDTAGAALGRTIAALQTAGLDAANRKYLVFADTTFLVGSQPLCGIASYYGDDRAQDNYNLGSWAEYARVDTGCWNSGGAGAQTDVPAHELMHTLGAVQTSAPNATSGGHCTDGYDIMCYDDGSGATFSHTACPDPNARFLFDCNNDDYFSTDPPAGSYLATHWNTADSPFLDQVVRAGSSITLDPSTGASATDTFAWTLSATSCSTVGATDRASLTIACPSTATGTVDATLTVTDGQGTQTTTRLSVVIDSSSTYTPVLSLQQVPGADGQSTLTAQATVDGAPVSAPLHLVAVTAAGHADVPGVTSTGPDGTASVSVTPSATTTYYATVLPSGPVQWSGPATATVTVAGSVAPAPVSFAPSAVVSATAGWPSTLTATVVRGFDPAVGLPMSVQSLATGSSTWATAVRLDTDAGGGISTAVQPTVPSTYRVLGDDPTSVSTAASVAAPTTTTLSVRSSGSRLVSTGSTLDVTGHAVATGGLSVQLQYRIGASGTWTTFTTATTTAAGAFSSTNTGPATLTYYRAVTLTAPGHLSSTSTTSSLRAPTTLAVSSRPGRPDRLIGTLRAASTGAPVTGAQIGVYYRLPTSRTWTLQLVVRTNSSGQVGVLEQPRRPTNYMLSYSGSATTLSTTSATAGFSY